MRSKPVVAKNAAPKRDLFGPAPHNAWASSTDSVSLVRQPLPAKPIRFDAEPQSIEIDIARSAVIVVDMQNDFCHPDGWFGQQGISVRPTRKPIPTIARLLPEWRAAGGAVLWLNWGVRADLLNLSPTIRFKGKGGAAAAVGYAERSPNDKGRSLVPGDWGARIVDEFAVAPTDITVFKHRLSGFWDNELDTVLRHQGITTLLFAGVNTDRCVFLTDACSTSSPAYVSRAIHFIVRQLHGFVATAEGLLTSLAAGKRPKRSSTRSTPGASA